MPVDSRHIQYTRQLHKVRKVRDFVEGGLDAKKHIIRLPAHDEEEYQAWKDGASFLPATERTLDAFVGMIMEPEPQTEFPASFQPYLDDVSNNGEPFKRVAARIARELFITGRGCVVIDSPSEDEVFAKDPELARTAGNYMALGGRPYAKLYKFENILYWRVENVGGVKRLKELRLMEYHEEPDPDDEWEIMQVPRIRVMDIFQGRYRVRMYKQEREKYTDEMGQEQERMIWLQDGVDVFPRVGRNPEGVLPVIMFGPDTLDPEDVSNPPLLDLVNLNCDHLQNSASLESTVRNLGCATLFIKAHPPTDDAGNTTPIRFGSTQAIIIPDGDAKLLALDASGVSGIVTVMERKEKQMVAIGARALQIDHTGGQVSTETERIRRAGEHSMLAEIANTLSDGLTQMLQWVARWAGIEGDITCTLNTDYLPAGLTQGELTEWTNAYLQGTIPLRTFLNRLKERGVEDPEMTVEDYRADLEEDAAAREFTDVGDGNEDNDEGDGGEPPEDNDEGENEE